MRGAEAVEPRQQPAEREAADGADAQHLAPLAAVEAVEHARHPVEGLAEHRQQGLAFVGQRQPARQAAEQGQAEPFLQRLHLMAQRRRRDAKLDRGPGEAQMARRRLEGAKAVEREIGADHGLLCSGRGATRKLKKV